MNKVEKKDTWKDVIILLLLLAVIGLGGYVCYDKLIKGHFTTENEKIDNKEATNKDENQKEDEEIEDEEKIDEIKANEQLDKLNTALHFALDFENVRDDSFDETYWYLPKNIKYNKELLATNAQKNDFVFGTLVLLSVDSLIVDESYTGEEATGSYSISYDVYAQYYKDLLGDNLVKSTKYSSNECEYYIVSKNNIYGGFWSGYGPLGTILKYNSLNEIDGEYTLDVDVIAYDIEEYDKVMGYDKYDVVEYPKEVVSYKLKLILAKVNEELYTIKSIQVVK